MPSEMKQLSTWLPDEVEAQLRELAKQERRSVSSLIRVLIEERLERETTESVA